MDYLSTIMLSNNSDSTKKDVGGVPIKNYNLPIAKDLPSDPASKSLRLNNIALQICLMCYLKALILNNLKDINMLRKILIIAYFLPLCLVAQQVKNAKCKDKNRKIDQLPCKFIEHYGTDIISDEETAIKYTDILIRKELLDPEKVEPYQISLIADNKVWHIVVKNYNCFYCKIYININKNTGEVLNYYKSED